MIEDAFGPYWDGENQVYGDPLELNLALVGHAEGKLSQLLEDSRSDDNALAFPAIYKMRELARLTFDLIPFDKTTGSGAQAKDCDKVLTDFFAFLAKKNGQEGTKQTSPLTSGPQLSP